MCIYTTCSICGSSEWSSLGYEARPIWCDKLFVVGYRNGPGDGSAPGCAIAKRFDCPRYVWLCPACSQVVTVQASQGGGVRLALVRGAYAKGQPENSRVSLGEQVLASTGSASDWDMQNTEYALGVLMRELEFLENGGYRLALGWRPPFIFEDSPTCPKAPFCACPNSDCTLMHFVPEERRNQPTPCRHIPLNEAGETLHTLYNTATNEEIEQVLREWLHKAIAELKQAARSKEDRFPRVA